MSTVISRQRQTSLSDDSANIFRACATFGLPRHWLLEPRNVPREPQLDKKPIPCESIFIMAAHGAIIQYDLNLKFIASELTVEFDF